MAYESSYTNIYFKIKKNTLFEPPHVISTGSIRTLLKAVFLFPKTHFYMFISTSLILACARANGEEGGGGSDLNTDVLSVPI